MMNELMRAKLKHFIVSHEDYRKFPYVDTVGKITIGIGYNLTDRGLPDNWINAQYEQDISYFYNQLSEDYPWFRNLDENRQIVLIDMCFMGYKNFQEFKGMIQAFADKDYKRAAFEILHSEWAKEVKGRAVQNANIVLTGEL